MGFVANPIQRASVSDCSPFECFDKESSSEKVIKLVLEVLAVIPFLVRMFKATCTFISSHYIIGDLSSLKKINAGPSNYITGPIEAKKVVFETEGGQHIHGMHYTGGHNGKTILICSGSHQSQVSFNQELFCDFRNQGYNILAFDYEGFGESEGSASETGIYRSTEAAYQYLMRNHVSKENLICWGYSLGSSAAVYLGKKYGTNIVLDRGFSKISLVAYARAPNGLKSLAKFIFEQGVGFDNESELSKCKGKVRVVSAMDDTDMPKIHHFDRLKDKFKHLPNFRFIEVPGSHDHIYVGQTFWYEKEEFRNQLDL